MEKGCKNHKKKSMYVVDKPCNIYRLRGNPMMIIGLPGLQGFPTTGKTCKDPAVPCKHLQCTHYAPSFYIKKCGKIGTYCSAPVLCIEKVF